MRRLLLGAALVAAVALIVTTTRRMSPAIRARCGEACDRMLSGMPESFPPNRMLADLGTLKERTARILDVLEPPAEAQSEEPVSAQPRSTAAAQPIT